LSARAPTLGKKARRKAAQRRVRMAAVASGGECHDEDMIEAEEVQEPIIEGCLAEDASSSKEPCLSRSSVDEADTSGEARSEQESPSLGRKTNPRDRQGNIMKCHNCQSDQHLSRECTSPAGTSPRKKERKQVVDSESFGGHSRVASQSTACGSSCEVKSNYSECGSEITGSDMGVLSMVDRISTMPTAWVSNGGRGDAVERHLCSPQHLDNSLFFRAVVKNTFLELEVASSPAEPTRMRTRSVDASY